jgi:DNA-binding transcriptional regulator GbsR (MarR family)
MEEAERLQKQRELIEQVGRYSEKEGFQPVAARIMGLLMVMDKEEYTFDEIVEEMKISKSSASTALRNLELRGVIEYVTYHGDRKRYFRFITSDTKTLIEETKKKLMHRAEIIDLSISLKKNANSTNAKLLRNLSKGMKFFISKMDELKNQIE